MLKNAIRIIIMGLMLITVVGCGTVNCNKCPVIVQTKILTPTISCYRPEPYDEFRKDLLSTEGINSEGKLLEVIVVNIKMMERHIRLWENYRKCVDDTIKIYANDIQHLQNTLNKDSK